MQDSDILTISRRLADTIKDEVHKASLELALGSEIGALGASGHATKMGDDIAESVAKRIIAEEINKYPGEKIVLISEETGIIIYGDNNSTEGAFFVLDPIDGSNNLRPWRTPCPFVSVAVAAGSIKNLANKHNLDAIDVAVVTEIFADLTYVAVRGQGAQVDDFGQISTSPLTDLSQTILGMDLDLQQEKFDNYLPKVQELLRNKKCQRRLGSSILDFLKVACGEYDGALSLTNRMGFYDIAPIRLILEEAGGVLEYKSTYTNECIIKELINTQDKSLLETTKYSFIGSGNKGLQEQLKAIVNW